MRRKLSQLVLFGFILVTPTRAAQQAPPGPPPPPSQDAKDKSKPQAQDKSERTPMQDTAPPSPSSAEEDIDVATYYIHKGDPDAAIPRLEEAIQVKPKLAKPRLMLAEIYEKKGDGPDATKYYKEYLQVFPTAPDAKKIEKKIEKLTNR